MSRSVHEGEGGLGGLASAGKVATTVLHVGGLGWASEKAVLERVLGRRPGVRLVEANPVAQTATVTFDTGQTSVAELRRWVQECGFHCAGQSVPSHVCDPMAEPDPPRAQPAMAVSGEAPPAVSAVAEIPAADGGREMAAERAGPSAHEMMGHGGAAGMSMAAMVRDMRNRFLVAAVFSVPILLWSPIGRDVLGFNVAAPFGLRDDVWLLVLSLPVIFYSSWIFFDGAVRALRAATLDMMVLVAVAIGAGWLYSLVVTLTGGGDTFYEAATVLAAFVLLGHWFEMRARGGANDAIRALLDLAPPRATVIRGGEPVEVPTAEIVAGDLLLVRPGDKIGGDRREPAGVQGPRVGGDRGDHQQERDASGARHQGRRRHRPGPDRQTGPGGAELQGAGAAARGSRRVLAGVRRADRRGRHAGGLAGGGPAS